jgi:hypothetical protein
LGARPGWSLQPSSSPGIDPLWCFGPDTASGTDIQVTVSVVGSTVSIYLVEHDLEFVVPDEDALATWVSENEPLFANRSQVGPDVFDEVLRERMATWRRRGL